MADSRTTILDGEKFRDFYIRTRGSPWPGVPGEERFSDVIKLVMDATADWFDALKER